jgi:cytochrome c-type biogenesis protein CcmH/NrfG
VLRINPNNAGACNNLAWICATHPNPTHRDGAQAVTLAQHGVELSPNDPAMFGTLAAAYAEAGRFPEAVEAAEQAVRLAAATGNRPLAEQLHGHLELFKNGMPYHQPPNR